MSTLDLIIELLTAVAVLGTAFFNARGRNKINKATDHISKQVTPGNGPGTLANLVETSAARDQAQDANDPPAG